MELNIRNDEADCWTNKNLLEMKAAVIPHNKKRACYKQL